MSELRQLACCGLNEIHGISHITTVSQADDAFEALFYGYSPNPPPRAFLLFTAARARGGPAPKYGDIFKARIVELGIGTVTETDWTLNPNSSNEIKLYTWHLNRDGLKAWMAKRFGVPVKPLVNVPLTPGQVGNASSAAQANVNTIVNTAVRNNPF